MKLTDEQRDSLLKRHLRHSNDSGYFCDVQALMDDIEAELAKHHETAFEKQRAAMRDFEKANRVTAYERARSESAKKLKQAAAEVEGVRAANAILTAEVEKLSAGNAKLAGMARDWQAMALRDAAECSGTREGAESLVEAKRYGLLADALSGIDVTAVYSKGEG